jgi:hypothetical protein
MNLTWTDGSAPAALLQRATKAAPDTVAQTATGSSRVSNRVG